MTRADAVALTIAALGTAALIVLARASAPGAMPTAPSERIPSPGDRAGQDSPSIDDRHAQVEIAAWHYRTEGNPR